jgi:fibro-slime domain-containing protein
VLIAAFCAHPSFFNSTFAYLGGEVFNFCGDDDVWVFANNQIIMDLGGVHGTICVNVNLDTVASKCGMTIGGTYRFDMFYNERHTSQSDLAFTTSIQFVQSTCSPSAQPPFKSNCNANTTLVLDASAAVTNSCGGTGQPSCQTIRDAITNYVQSLYQTSLLGAPMYVSVIRFGTTASLDFPMTRLTSSFVTQFTTWINANYLTAAGSLGLESNWADALYLAYNPMSSPTPNELIFFAAGPPTVSGPLHLPGCTTGGGACSTKAAVAACKSFSSLCTLFLLCLTRNAFKAPRQTFFGPLQTPRCSSRLLELLRKRRQTVSLVL